MKNLYEVLNENRIEAVEKLKKFGKTLEFDYDENNNVDERPFVLISNRYGEIYDIEVSKVKLDTNNNIMLYIDDWGEWVNETECLSASADNVYYVIDKIIE